jgi:hypothetical protein
MQPFDQTAQGENHGEYVQYHFRPIPACLTVIFGMLQKKVQTHALAGHGEDLGIFVDDIRDASKKSTDTRPGWPWRGSGIF